MEEHSRKAVSAKALRGEVSQHVKKAILLYSQSLHCANLSSLKLDFERGEEQHWVTELHTGAICCAISKMEGIWGRQTEEAECRPGKGGLLRF